MNHAVPSVAGVVDDDVNLAIAEVSGLLDERVKVFVVQHISWSGDSLSATLVDSIRDTFRFLYSLMSES